MTFRKTKANTPRSKLKTSRVETYPKPLSTNKAKNVR